MFTTNHLSAKTAILLILLTAAGCKSRLDADFEADSVGSAPAESPASEADDSIYVLDFHDRGSAVVTASGALSGNKSLRINGPGSIPAAGIYATSVYMYAEPLQYHEKVYASWSGKLASGVGAEIMLSNGHFVSLVKIELRNSQFIVNGSVAGSYTPGQEHMVLITVQRNGRFSASINGGGAEGSVSNRPLLGSFTSEHVQLNAQLLGGNSSSYYLLDDVNISEDEPE